MKKQILGFVLGLLFIPLGGVMAQDHADHDMKSQSESKQYEVSTDFQKQLKGVYQVSLAMNKSFVAGDVQAVKENGATMVHKVSEVDMATLEGEGHMIWMKNMKLIIDGLDKIIISDEIDEQRSLYANVNEGLYQAVKSFGVGETVFYLYCPMKKSSWLNDSEKVNNPYYGKMMLSCGSTKEVIN